MSASMLPRAESIDALFAEQPDLSRLLWVLQRAKGFALYFARCNVPTYREQLAQALRAKLERPLVEVTLDRSDEGTPDARLAHAVEAAAPEAVVFVYNLESILPSDDPSRPERALHALNWRRNAYERLGHPLVFWLPEYALTLLAREAPDFFDWHSGLYEFDVPESLYPRLAIETLQLIGPDMTALWNLSVEEKRRWKVVLEDLVAEPQRDTEIDKQARAAIFLQLGQLLYTLGRYDEARHWLNQALEINRALKDDAQMAATMHRLAAIDFAVGEDEAGLKRYEQSLKILEELGDLSGMVQSLHLIGRIHQIRGEYEAALRQHERSLQIAKGLGDLVSVAGSLHQIGNIHYLRGEYEAALRQYERSLKISEELGNRVWVAGSLHRIGRIYQARGEYEAALRQYERSLKIKEELGDRAGVASSLHQIGMIHQDRGEYEAALQQYERSLKIKEELGDQAGVARTLHQLGTIHQDRGEYELAMQQYERSLKIKEELGDRAGVARSHGQIGKLFAETGRYPEAFEHFLFALLTFTQWQSPDAGIAVNDLKDLRAKWGKKKFDAAWQQATGEAAPEGLVE